MIGVAMAAVDGSSWYYRHDTGAQVAMAAVDGSS